MNNIVNLLVPFFIVAPLFISLTYSFDVAFDRVGGKSGDVFFITIPFSVVTVVGIGVFFYKKLLYRILFYRHKAYYFYFINYIALCFLLFYVYQGEGVFSVVVVKNLLHMFVLFFLLYIFYVYFKSVSLNFKTENRMEDMLVIYPLCAAAIVYIISGYYFGRYNFLSSDIVIYSFNQYYSFVYVIFIGIAYNRNIYLFILASVFAVYLSMLSANATSLLISIALIVYCIFDLVLKEKYKSALSKLSVILSVVSVILSFVMIPYFADNMIGGQSLLTRGGIITYFFSTLDFSIILPFMSSSNAELLHINFHNNYLSIYYYTGLVGVFVYFLFVMRFIGRLEYKYRSIKISLVFVIMLGGITTSITMHLYTLIFLTYILSFYVFLSDKYRLNVA